MEKKELICKEGISDLKVLEDEIAKVLGYGKDTINMYEKLYAGISGEAQADCSDERPCDLNRIKELTNKIGDIENVFNNLNRMKGAFDKLLD